MSISKQSKLKNDVVNDIVQRLGQLPDKDRLHVLAAVFSVMVEVSDIDPNRIGRQMLRRP
jgi:hypothetical protein